LIAFPSSSTTGGSPVPFFINESSAPFTPLRQGRGLSFKLLNPSTGSERVDVHVNVLNVGSGPGPYHFHSQADNIYYVIEGQAKVTVEDRAVIAGPGEAALIFPGERHDIENVGPVPLRVVEIRIPAESDFIEVDGPDIAGP
jgi:mannose-6-phosphate isomerase-like protein (cupin superfamily)